MLESFIFSLLFLSHLNPLKFLKCVVISHKILKNREIKLDRDFQLYILNNEWSTIL
jgi:hypothetical protein